VNAPGASLSDAKAAELEKMAKKLRRDIILMVGANKPGHIGGSCSLAEIVATLYFHAMRHNPRRPGWPGRDRFILSKGHAAPIQYAALAECGYFPRQRLDTLKELGTTLQGHPDMTRTRGVEANTGSLGQGLSIACGMALAGKLDGKDYRVYCILGDGEIAEGQVWEASMAAAFYRLDNLTAILDKNRIQATGPVADRYDTNPHAEKWRAFGWNVVETDGHDVRQVAGALEAAAAVKGKPTMIVARTVKGKGIPFAEDTALFHHGIMTKEQYEAALKAVSD